MNKTLTLYFIFFATCSTFAQNKNTPLVAVDQLNILYLGIDNPISICSPEGFDHTIVTMTNGTITGNGSQIIVRPNEIGEAEITINVNGTITSYKYMVKNLPDPVFKVGSGNTYMSLEEFKEQEVCRLEFDTMALDINFKLISATVYFINADFSDPVQVQMNGNNLSSLSEHISRCKQGTTVVFDDIKIESPGGMRQISGVYYKLY